MKKYLFSDIIEQDMTYVHCETEEQIKKLLEKIDKFVPKKSNGKNFEQDVNFEIKQATKYFQINHFYFNINKRLYNVFLKPPQLFIIEFDKIIFNDEIEHEENKQENIKMKILFEEE
jgi:hypothetical protein